MSEPHWDDKQLLHIAESIVGGRCGIDTVYRVLEQIRNDTHKAALAAQAARIAELEKYLRESHARTGELFTEVDGFTQQVSEDVATINRLYARLAELEANEKSADKTIADIAEICRGHVRTIAELEAQVDTAYKEVSKLELAWVEAAREAVDAREELEQAQGKWEPLPDGIVDQLRGITMSLSENGSVFTAESENNKTTVRIFTEQYRLCRWQEPFAALEGNGSEA